MASPPRSMFKGVIQFGLVTVPCRLYLAIDPHASGAHLLHTDCLGRVQQKTWCAHCDCEITRSETVRGFPVGDGRYVTVTEEEFATLPVETLHAIKVLHFIPAADAATLTAWSRQPYYLAPEDLGRHAFALLCVTLEEAELAAVAKLTIREREYVATIRPLDDGLLLTTLAWPEEIRSIQSLDLPSHDDLSEVERGLARDLVLAMQRPFEPSAVRDEYAEALRRLVESKAAGAAFALPDAEPATAFVDLMAALRASVAAATETPSSDRTPTPSRKARTGRKAVRATAA